MVFKDFVTRREASPTTLATYQGRVPDSLLTHWKTHGFGSFYDGYFRLIDPDDYLDLIQSTYYRGQMATPSWSPSSGMWSPMKRGRCSGS